VDANKAGAATRQTAEADPGLNQLRRQ